MTGPAGGGRPWWEDAVVYQIYPRSFCDASGDGVGDLEGVRRHLDHLVWLGVDALWLSPFYPSPMADFGYDVADYCDVDPTFGTLEDFDRLVEGAHERGLKVIVDWVPNHTSDAHPWFVESRSSRHSPKRDWYWWRDDRPDSAGGEGPPGADGRRPNNWRAAFAGVGRTGFPPAWTWDEATGQWYLHMFLAEQPDLNWSNPEVEAAMTDVLRFWLDRGADGFRIDVVHAIGKDARLSDLPDDQAWIPVCALHDDADTHPILARLREVTDGWEPPRVMIGETVLPTVDQIAPYYGTPERPELALAFNFHPLRSRWAASSWRRRIDDAERLFTGRGRWPTWVLSNHDNPRHRTRYDGSEAKARAAAVALLTLRGTPFLYAGEELGLEDALVPPDRQMDPGPGRDGCRAPIPWDGTAAHGWAGGPRAWLPWPPEAGQGRNVADQAESQLSTLNLYRSLIAIRRRSGALKAGSFTWSDSPADVLAYRRDAPGDARLVLVNYADTARTVALPQGNWVVDVSSLDGATAAKRRDGVTLRGLEALLLRLV